MNITHDVITDLLPLYLAGEASSDTRALLEEYLRAHPAFAADIRAHAEKSVALLSTPTISPSSDHEKATFERVRRFNRRRTQILAFALACTLMPFAVAFGHRTQWVMLRDAPQQAAFFAIVAAGCWITYALMGRRVRTGP